MSIEELLEKDVDFKSDEFITRANNMIKKIYNAITLNELEKVHHFMSDDLFQKIQSDLDNNRSLGKRLIYEEVNVDCQISNILEDDNYFTIVVACPCKYLKYYLSLTNGSVIGGDNTRRLSEINTLIFQKKKGATRGEIARCLGCGNTLNINNNGKCPNCGRIYDLDEFDYIMKELN